MRTTPDDLAEYFRFGREQRHVEFKVGGCLEPKGTEDEKLLFAKVIRAMLAMVNQANGGIVVLGVAERGGAVIPEGMAAGAAPTWAYDRLADLLRAYADPPIDFDIGTCEVDGRVFVVIEVREFSDIPVLCRKTLSVRTKAGDQVLLRDGGLYVRGRRKIESVEVPSTTEMRELIDLAIDKGGRRLVARLGRLLAPAEPPSPSDDDLFKAQRGSMT